MNGFALRDLPESNLKEGDLVTKVADLKADGSTSSGAGSTRASSRAG